MFWFLDGLSILFVLFIGYNGFKKGIIEELGRLLGIIVAVLISISNSTSFAIKFNRIFQIDSWLIVCCSFVFLFTITLLLTRVLTKLVQYTFLSKSNRFMNKTMGFIFGSIKGCFILIIFFWFIAILPDQKWINIIDQNSNFAIYSHKLRIKIVSFFNWEDPVSLSESYIKKITQP